MEVITPAIEIIDVTKTYRGSEFPALQNINLKILPGEKVGLVGANGSGKTTLLKLIMNFLIPDRGEIRIMGDSNPEKNKQFIGYIGELQEGLENFTPRELFRLAARMYGFSGTERDNRVNTHLQLMGLEEVQNELMAGFSKGMRQRVFLSLAILHQPRILLLDEPLSGLDAEGQATIRNLLNQLNTETIIFASHQLEDIEEFSSRVFFLHQGKIVAEIGKDEMLQEIYTLEGPPEIEKILSEMLKIRVRNIQFRGASVRLQLTLKPDQLQHVLTEFKKRNITLHRIRSQSILTELYQQYVQQNP